MAYEDDLAYHLSVELEVGGSVEKRKADILADEDLSEAEAEAEELIKVTELLGEVVLVVNDLNLQLADPCLPEESRADAEAMLKKVSTAMKEMLRKTE